MAITSKGKHSNKRKNKKSNIVPKIKILIFILLLVLFIKSIYAYFVSEDSVTNLFTVKKTHTVTYNYYLVESLTEEPSTIIYASEEEQVSKNTKILLNESKIKTDNDLYEFIEFKIGDTSYKLGDKYKMPNEDIVINEYYGVKYTITYDLDDGSLEEENPESYTIASDDITLNNPSKEHYTFEGWIRTDLPEQEQEEPSKTVVIPRGSTGNRAYKAVFTQTATFVKGETLQRKNEKTSRR